MQKKKNTEKIATEQLALQIHGINVKYSTIPIVLK
jgi:hypothetical protein